MNTNERIVALMRERGWTEYRLAKESGLSQSTIANLFQRNTIPSISTLESICTGFGITLAQFFSDGNFVELTDEQVEKLRDSFNLPCVKLADVPVGEMFKISSHEFIVLEHSGDTTAVILKELLKDQQFGANNNYDGSHVDATCNKFAEEIEAAVGKGNLCEHTVDLTADDGLKCYGAVKRKASLLTTEKYRRFVYTLDKHKIDAWWWLATAFSTAVHGYKTAVKCVAPSGYVGSSSCDVISYGVRPFCILKSTIFESSEA